MNAPARYIMLGGFLGAGKTTTLIRLAEHLQRLDKRVGIITNDQAAGLVDTAVVKANRVPVEEIAGGCFCCRFPSLQEAAERLSAEQRPDIFLGEPVGSCTDLVATVSYPLRRLYGDRFVIAPLSVVVDARRALRMFGLQDGKTFSEKVAYIYTKQIEEAHALLINKIDQIDGEALQQLLDYVAEHWPNKSVFTCSALNDDGLDEWKQWVLDNEIGDGRSLDIDYQDYADGEAALAWCNASLEVNADAEFDGNAFLADCMSALAESLHQADAAVAHMKMTLSPEDGSGEIASSNIVDDESAPAAGQQLMDPLAHGAIMINIRAETDPAVLQAAVYQLLARQQQQHDLQLALDDLECFRPSAPVPVHRMNSMHGDCA